MSALDILIEKDELTKGEDISFLELTILEISKRMPRIGEKAAEELAEKDARIAELADELAAKRARIADLEAAQS